jgi:hypothetical protein
MYRKRKKEGLPVYPERVEEGWPKGFYRCLGFAV